MTGRILDQGWQGVRKVLAVSGWRLGNDSGVKVGAAPRADLADRITFRWRVAGDQAETRNNAPANHPVSGLPLSYFLCLG